MHAKQGSDTARMKLLGCALVFLCASMGNAQIQAPTEKKTALPMPTKETGNRMREGNTSSPARPVGARALKCELLDWKNEAPSPVLTVACPPEGVYAPLRIYFGFSWERLEEVPSNAGNIVAAPKTLTRVDFRQTEALIWLKVSENGERKLREQWVRFTSITKIGVSSEP
jgi:hypothetical protein